MLAIFLPERSPALSAIPARTTKKKEADTNGKYQRRHNRNSELRVPFLLPSFVARPSCPCSAPTQSCWARGCSSPRNDETHQKQSKGGDCGRRFQGTLEAWPNGQEKSIVAGRPGAIGAVPAASAPETHNDAVLGNSEFLMREHLTQSPFGSKMPFSPRWPDTPGRKKAAILRARR